ncbi:MAG: CsbD family protein [Planctomycetaceae bacterium]|nr:CsbD family protein [Planctomycetaceae bacterium]
MKTIQIKGDWKQFFGKVKTKWGKLTGNEPATIAEQREQLIDFLQQRYGYEKEQAETALDKELSCSH